MIGSYVLQPDPGSPTRTSATASCTSSPAAHASPDRSSRSATAAATSFAEGNGHILEYSDDAAFWVLNKVAHLAYLQDSLTMPDIQKVQSELEALHHDMIPAIDRTAAELYERDPDLARDFLTRTSVSLAEDTVERWQDLFPSSSTPSTPNGGCA